jgi:hypothetical protein
MKLCSTPLAKPLTFTLNVLSWRTVLPKIQANQAGAADALMLDTDGFVSETNATNVFMVKHGAVLTPHADYCLPGELAVFFFFRTRKFLLRYFEVHPSGFGVICRGSKLHCLV